LFRVAAKEARDELLLVWRRELFTNAYTSRWVTAHIGDDAVRALTFVANPLYQHYAGRLDESEIAARVASGTGSLGTCREYLSETLAALHAMGLRDHKLERLQRLISSHSATETPR
jgi:cation transport protein ChaC